MRDVILSVVLAAIAITATLMAPFLIALAYFILVFALVAGGAWCLLKLIQEDDDESDRDS